MRRAIPSHMQGNGVIRSCVWKNRSGVGAPLAKTRPPYDGKRRGRGCVAAGSCMPPMGIANNFIEMNLVDSLGLRLQETYQKYFRICQSRGVTSITASDRGRRGCARAQVRPRQSSRAEHDTGASADSVQVIGIGQVVADRRLPDPEDQRSDGPRPVGRCCYA